MTMSVDAAAQRVGRVLNPVLSRYHFAGGQVGVHGDSFSVLFCAAFDHYVDAFPDLSDAGYDAPGNGACIDLHVHGAAPGLLTDVDLEGVPLPALLQHAGLHDAAATAASLHELPLDDALAAIAGWAPALFGREQP